VNFWNEILVPKFTRYKHVLVDGLGHHSAAIFPDLRVKEGDRIVDVGCGFGDTAILLARCSGPEGEVLGIDGWDAFLEHWRRDAAAENCENVRFIEADVQSYPFQGDFDFCFSRFGTQFFENPVAGLKNMRRSLKPGGIMTMIVWRRIDDNPWLGLPKKVVAGILPPPGENARSCGPGPFSMANQEMVTKQLEIAGYDEITFRRVDAPLIVGENLDDAMGFQIALGPAGEIFREAGEEGRRRFPEIEVALKEALFPYLCEEGVVMESSSWVISARNPG
jgi:SAM-dependent methyltransferase